MDADTIRGIIESDDDRKAIGKAIRFAGTVFRELLPVKHGSSAHIAAGDPYNTARILEVLAFLYPAYADRLEVTPDLDSPQTDIRLDMKGRIRLGVLALSFLKLWSDRRVRLLYKKIKASSASGGSDGQTE